MYYSLYILYVRGEFSVNILFIHRLQCRSTVKTNNDQRKNRSKGNLLKYTPFLLVFMYTYKASNGIQLYNTPRFCCGLLTDDVEHLPNIFLE